MLGLIPGEFPDKLYPLQKLEGLSYHMLKPHDRIFIRLDNTGV